LGTVSVTLNSSTVTGVNTAFAANTRVGDAFIGPDGRQYELGNVVSDTVISIVPPYLGATSSGASYAVVPVQGYQKGLADQVRDWVNTYGSKMAALGTTGNYDVLPVNKGGTNVTTMDALLAALQTVGAYGKTNSVGTVSQSGGVPTGAILQSGVVGNATYTKYADGTLICRGISTTFYGVSNPATGSFYSAAQTFTFPAQFIQVPSISPSAITASNNFCWAATEGSTTTTGLTMRLVSPGSNAVSYMCYIAIGRWY
jgi:hypothetical protein